MINLPIYILVLSLPGIIGTILIEKLSAQKKFSQFEFSVRTLLMSASSYLMAQTLKIPYGYIQKGTSNQLLKIWSLDFHNVALPYTEVLSACGCSFALAVTISWVGNKKTLSKTARQLNISTKMGESSGFYYFMNSEMVSEIYVRDIANNLTYHGIVIAFDQTTSHNEIILSDVNVYRYEDSAHLYNMKSIYLSLPKEKTILELP